MSRLLFTNNASTTLGSAASAGDTTLTVASGTGNEFPSPTGGDYFSATLWAAGSTTGTPNEIVYVTARSGDTMTVIRGQEGTTAQSWNVGDTFANYPTAAFFNGVATSSELQSQTGNFADDTGTANAGVVTLSPVPTLTSLVGAPIRVLKIANANTGAYTLNVNGLGAKPVTLNGVALSAGQLAASQIFEVAYDGTNFELLSFPASITNNELAQMAAATVKANITGGTANPVDVPLASFLAALGLGTGSLGTSGYIQVPIVISGNIREVIIQWAFTPTLTNQATNTVTFPIALPNAALFMDGSLGTALVLTSNAIGCGFAAISNTQGHISISTASPGTTGVNYWVIGW